nr:putative antennal esterase CXE34 [Ectropis grisescens]
MEQKMDTIPEESKCIVNCKDGPVCGYKDVTENGTFYKFKGIPYANPPIGRLRFMPPTQFKPWTETKDCTQDFPAPLQYEKECTECLMKGSEDCLYIEISTPSINPDKPLPVMFWVGCYAFAFSMDFIFDTSLLTAENVIFARCGFRLGPFGFLSINDFTAPGNCGLKDIVLALKWVQRNISCFGGDPTNVTIFGSSSGGAIVHLMTLSPMATGLFHRAIIQSASALNNWSLCKNPTLPVIEMGNMLGINKTDQKSDIVEELRSLPAVVILETFKKMAKNFEKEESRDVIDAIFKPCIEVEFEGQPAFLTRTPASLLKSGNFNKIPLIIGSNNIEGAILEYIKEDFYDSFEKYNQNKDLLVPRFLSGETGICKTLGHQILKFYLGGDEQLREDTKAQYLQLITDYYYLYYVNKTLRLHKQYAPECPVYYYILNYAGEWAVPPKLRLLNSSGHIAEVPFLFGIKFPGPETLKGSRDSVTTRARMVRMWTNFSKYGNPTPDENDPLIQITWDPVENQDKLNYLSIGAELTKGTNPFQERMSFWDDLHRENVFLRTLVYFTDLGVSW